MNTMLIGLKEFKTRPAHYAEKMKKENIQLVVLNKNTPLFEVKVVQSPETFVLSTLEAEISESRKQGKNNETYTLDEVRALL